MPSPPRIAAVIRPWIGLAGWANPPVHRSHRSAEQTHLQYYAAHFSCVEINSSFYRQHRASTYAGWRATTPAVFRFAVKMPRSITHEGRLRGVAGEIDLFFAGIEALLPKLAAVLVQLPPSLEFDPKLVREFFRALPRLPAVQLVCEPRHATWFTGAADELLKKLSVSRVAADPAMCSGAELPGGNGRFRYFRWHGAPKMYYSSYSQEQLAHLSRLIRTQAQSWCIFDNTARYAAWDNATDFQSIWAPSCPPQSSI